MKIRRVKIRMNQDVHSEIKEFADIYIKDGFMVRDVPIVEREESILLDFPFKESALLFSCPSFLPPRI